MQIEYFNFGTPHPDMDGKQLLYDESRELLLACNNHPNIKVIELRCLDSKSDIIIIECTDETIISRNKGQIKRAKERLALCYNPKLKYPHEVRPLRKEFPATQHQFHVLKGKPKSLCLYNEVWSVVERKWTPEKHLERIFWWLRKASQGKLHGNSQPLEQLYYTNSKKILLPPDFHSVSPSRFLQFRIKKVFDSWHEGDFIINSKENPSDKIIADSLILNLKPVITGSILETPDTLGELNQQLKERGSGLINELKEAILTKAPSSGIERSKDRKTFIFINTPIIRKIGGRTERTDTKCYVVDSDLYSLGLKLGILIQIPTDSRAYRLTKLKGVKAKNKKVEFDDSWKELSIVPYEVKSRYSCEDARRASGFTPIEFLDKLLKKETDDEKRELLNRGKEITKFDGILAGVGALGSTMADIWSKECWGSWTYVDDDYLEPHNIIRHICKDMWLGVPKSVAVSITTNSNFAKGVQNSIPVVAKINAVDNQQIQKLLSSSDLLIDVTTTLDAPRDLSLIEDAPRMISVFITPSGNDSVLLSEDENRTIRLSSLEAQYYRAILTHKWGKQHLTGNKGKVTVGAGCRDSSFIMSYEPIQLHSAILAKQVRQKVLKKNARIQIWSAKQNSSIKTYKIPVFPVSTHQCGEWGIIWDEGLSAKAINYRTKELPNETGGIVLGYSDQKTKTIHIVDITSAPLDSDGDRRSFLRGTKEMKTLREKCQEKTANIVDYIGEWHSHTDGVPTYKSEKDIKQLEEITSVMSQDGLPAVMVIIGEVDISLNINQDSSVFLFKKEQQQ